MSSIISDQEQKDVITGSFEVIELAIKLARVHMTGHPSNNPETVDSVFKLIENQARRSQSYKWPNPVARAAEAAKKDSALQKLIKRASKPTPIRAK